MLVKQRVKKLLSSLIIISALSLSGCGAKITQTNTTMTIESGDKLNFQPTDYFTSSKPDAFDEFVIDTTDVDTTTPGIYNIVVAYKKDRYSISVNVTETIQCIKDSFTTEAGMHSAGLDGHGCVFQRPHCGAKRPHVITDFPLLLS